jgi:hypothetical protein
MNRDDFDTWFRNLPLNPWQEQRQEQLQLEEPTAAARCAELVLRSMRARSEYVRAGYLSSAQWFALAHQQDEERERRPQ